MSDTLDDLVADECYHSEYRQETEYEQDCDKTFAHDQPPLPVIDILDA